MQYPCKIMHLFLVFATFFGVFLLGSGHSYAQTDEVKPIEIPPLPETEDALITLLQSNDASWAVKQAVCRRLRQIGTTKCIPALTALLDDPHLGGWARFALEPIPDPAVDRALEAAVSRLSGAAQQGVIVSLGYRRNAQAIPVLAPILGSQSNDVPAETRALVAHALGRIATVEAIKVLGAAIESTRGTPAVFSAVLDGLLEASRQAEEAGDSAAAQEACKTLEPLLDRPDVPTSVKEAVQVRLLLSGADEAAERFSHILQEKPFTATGVVVTVLRMSKGTSLPTVAEKVYARADAQAKCAILRGLAQRPEPTGRRLVRPSVTAKDPEVQVAGLQLLSRFPEPGEVRLAIKILEDKNPRVQSAAREVLRSMPGKTVEETLSKELKRARGDRKGTLLEILALRNAPDVVTIARSLLQESPSLRVNALRALGQHGTAQDLPLVLKHMESAQSAEEQQAAAEAARAIARAYPQDALPLLEQGTRRGAQETRILYVQILGRVGLPEALPLVSAALKDGDAALRLEAARALNNWPGLEALPVLLEMVQSDEDAVHDLGLRGYVRLVRKEPDLTKRAEMLKQIMPHARRTEEEFAVLSAWGTIPTAEAMTYLLPYLDKAEVRNEAAAALLTLIPGLVKNDASQKETARPILQRIRDEVDSEVLKGRAGTILATF